MKKSLTKEVYSYIKGVRFKRSMFLLSLPMILYAVRRIMVRYVFHREGVPINKLVFIPVCVLFCASLALVFLNVSDTIRLKKALSEIEKNGGLKTLEDDFRYGTVYLNKELIVGKRYIISKGSVRLFGFDELSGIFDDIRDTYNVFTMMLSGADDIVKTKIIKAEYKGKSFIHDRRICEIEVHKNYLSDIGETTGYDQLKAIEEEIWARIEQYKKSSGSETDL